MRACVRACVCACVRPSSYTHAPTLIQRFNQLRKDAPLRRKWVSNLRKRAEEPSSLLNDPVPLNSRDHGIVDGTLKALKDVRLRGCVSGCLSSEMSTSTTSTRTRRASRFFLWWVCQGCLSGFLSWYLFGCLSGCLSSVSVCRSVTADASECECFMHKCTHSA
jgi:hypothetical protein